MLPSSAPFVAQLPRTRHQRLIARALQLALRSRPQRPQPLGALLLLLLLLLLSSLLLLLFVLLLFVLSLSLSLFLLLFLLMELIFVDAVAAAVGSPAAADAHAFPPLQMDMLKPLLQLQQLLRVSGTAVAVVVVVLVVFDDDDDFVVGVGVVSPLPSYLSFYPNPSPLCLPLYQLFHHPAGGTHSAPFPLAIHPPAPPLPLSLFCESSLF